MILRPDLPNRKQVNNSGLLNFRAAGRKACPKCAESVKYEALKCKHCGHSFAPPGTSSFSELVHKQKWWMARSLWQMAEEKRL